MNKKRFLTLLLAGVLSLGLTACSGRGRARQFVHRGPELFQHSGGTFFRHREQQQGGRVHTGYPHHSR